MAKNTDTDTEQKEPKIAMQHHQLTSNNLFTVGRAGRKKRTEATWKGTFTDVNNEIISYNIYADCLISLNATDQDVFLHILYLHRLKNNWQIEQGDKSELKTTGDAAIGQHLALQVTPYQLVKQLGWEGGGKSYHRLYESLERLGRVYLLCQSEDKTRKRRWNSGILFHNYELHKINRDEKLTLVVCPLFAQAAHAQNASLHSSHCLTEREKLSNNAKILHAAICSRLRPGKNQRYQTSRLLKYMHGGEVPDRRAKSKSLPAINELGTLLNWKVTQQKDSDCWLIHRAKLEV